MSKIKYVPRHLRIGVCCQSDKIDGFHEIPEFVSVIDDSGNVIERSKSVKRVKASDDMSKFLVSNFKLSKLLKDGVPLKMVNVNRSSSFTIDELERIAQSIDDADQFVNRVMAERKERENWFNPPVPDDSTVQS